jgi:hypothetical protein
LDFREIDPHYHHAVILNGEGTDSALPALDATATQA